MAEQVVTPRSRQEPNVLKLEKAMVAAFDELHQRATEAAFDPNTPPARHHDYPEMTLFESGFPSFHDIGFYSDRAPRDYVGALRHGFYGLVLRGHPSETGGEYPAYRELEALFKSSPVGRKFQREDGTISAFWLGYGIGTAVDRYLNKYGVGGLPDPKRRALTLEPLLQWVISTDLELRLVVPIALTHFDCNYYRLTESAYITRLSKPLQLARAQVKLHGTGAVSNVVGAATHAFVSLGWTIPNQDGSSLRDALTPSPQAIEAADLFFAALRAATGATTGYGQMLFVPHRWAQSYSVDLPPVFGGGLRKYPSGFDNYGWAYGGQSRVSAGQLEDVRRIYKLLSQRSEERVAIARKRLNSCMTRDDPVDAILDATIGLEVLLSDDQNQALSYKLRLRAAALARVTGRRDPMQTAQDVNRIYTTRSHIVHGSSKKTSKKLQDRGDARYEQERALATELLRFVLDSLLENPRYLEPSDLDRELLITGGVGATQLQHDEQTRPD